MDDSYKLECYYDHFDADKLMFSIHADYMKLDVVQQLRKHFFMTTDTTKKITIRLEKVQNKQ